MALKVIIKGASKDESRLMEAVVRDAVTRVGIKGWVHLTPSHREGLVAREGLSLVLTQWGEAPAAILRRVAQLSARVASAACHDSCIGYDRITVDLEAE